MLKRKIGGWWMALGLMVVAAGHGSDSFYVADAIAYAVILVCPECSEVGGETAQKTIFPEPDPGG